MLSLDKIVQTMEEKVKEGSKVTQNIILGTDGKYHWFYEYKLMRNPTILFLIMKMFFWIDLGIFTMLLLFNAIGGRLDWEDFLGIGKAFLLMLAVFEVMTMLGYLLYAAIQGFKYCIMFEMDDKGVKHTQMPAQFKRAQAVAFLAALMAVATKQPRLIGPSLLSGSKQSMYTSWNSVRSIQINRKRQVIKLYEKPSTNQVYALPEDFDFVQDYITSHVRKK